MNKKVLIYFNEYHLKPIGGPAGYLYNLKKEIDEKKIENIYFIQGEDKDSSKKVFLHKLPKAIVKLYYLYSRIKERKYLLGSSKKEAVLDLNEYDIVHFHSTISLYKCKDSLENYKGKVVLTSHSPKPMFLEKYEDTGLLKFEKTINKKKYMEGYANIDEYAFNRADYIVFPCEEAEEPYYNNWERYKLIKEKNKDKYRYLLTGINPAIVKVKREDYRKNCNIPNEAFVISYVGRHNETKGYNVLTDIGNEVLTNDNFYFLIGGREEPLTGLTNDKWIEIGWTNDPHSLINSADVFILPNKETYFDLIMLEVLSLGKIVIASNTGGNKYFKKLNAEGVLLYNNVEELKELIQKISNMSIEERRILEQSNKEMFNNNFTKEIFTRNYVEILNTL